MSSSSAHHDVTQLLRSMFLRAWHKDRVHSLIIFGSGIVTLVGSALSAVVMERVLRAFLLVDSSSAAFSLWLSAVLGLGLIMALVGQIAGVSSELLGEELQLDGATELHTAAASLDLDDFDRKEIMDLLQKTGASTTTHEAQMFQDGSEMLNGSLRIIGLLFGAAVTAPAITGVLLIGVVPVVLIAMKSGTTMFAAEEAIIENRRRMAYYGWLFTSREASLAMRSLPASERVASAYRITGVKNIHILSRAIRRTAFLDTIGMFLLSAIIVVAVTFLSASGYVDTDSAATTTAVIVILTQVVGQLISLGNTTSEVRESLGFMRSKWQLQSIIAERVAGPKRYQVAVTAQNQTVEARSNFPTIVVNALEYDYENSAGFALGPLSLEFRSGRSYAIVGENGSGKSTFARLLAGLYEPKSGSITCVSDQKPFLASQEPFIFKSTIRDNVLWGAAPPDGDDAAVTRALLAVGGEDLLEKGLDQPLGPEFGGIDLSGGQIQTLALARAVYARNPVTIFDEPTSALDPHRERALLRELRRTFSELTTIFIVHRFALLEETDYIFVMREGRIVEAGFHGELLRIPDGLFRALYTVSTQGHNQLSEEAYRID